MPRTPRGAAGLLPARRGSCVPRRPDPRWPARCGMASRPGSADRTGSRGAAEDEPHRRGMPAALLAGRDLVGVEPVGDRLEAAPGGPLAGDPLEDRPRQGRGPAELEPGPLL